MSKERDKFLTEAMGECWHKSTKYLGENLTGWECDKCHKDAINNDFSTWEGFGKLWEWAQEQEWWGDFVGCLWEPVIDNGKPTHYRKFDLAFVNPDRFADALYEFLPASG